MRTALLLSLALNVLLGAVVARRWYLDRTHPHIPDIPLHQSGWLHQPAASGFARLPSDPGATVFLGDSITAEGPWGELFGRTLNRGVKGDTTLGVDQRLAEVTGRAPKDLVLMIGINDLLNGGSPEQVVRGVDRILERTRADSPSTRIFLSSLLPVDPSRVPFSNETIRKTNLELKRIAAERGAVYVDLHPLFADPSGALRADVTYDGLHLTADGYVVWRDALKPLLSAE